MGEVHDLSLFLLEWLEGQGISGDLALAATALTLVRLASPMQTLDAEVEVKNTQDVISFVQMSSDGRVN